MDIVDVLWVGVSGTVLRTFSITPCSAMCSMWRCEDTEIRIRIRMRIRCVPCGDTNTNKILQCLVVCCHPENRWHGTVLGEAEKQKRTKTQSQRRVSFFAQGSNGLLCAGVGSRRRQSCVQNSTKIRTR
jgi:hypothetical protein